MQTETDRVTGIVRRRVLRLAVGLVVLGAVMNLLFLFNHCPFQFSQDESHYWEWSRHLDYGYYSKPPGIAWLMAGTLRVAEWFGVDGNSPGEVLMPVLRTPAVLFGMVSGLLSLFLARRIFRDDRAALGVTVLSAAVPMFAVGSLLITIDSPMYLCWAGTVYCLWRRIECVVRGPWSVVSGGERSVDGPRGGGLGWLYLAGVVCAVGMLFKPVLIVIPMCAGIGAVMDLGIRRAVKTWHALGAMVIVGASQIPVVVWNAKHDWVTFRHMSTQGGLMSEGGEAGKWYRPLAHVGEFLGGQAGGMGGLVFVLLVVAVVVALRLRGKGAGKIAEEYAGVEGRGSGVAFLLAFTLPLWGFYFLLSLWKGTEVNWPAASYFTGMILLGGIFAAGWTSAVAATRRWWRLWGTVTVAWGILLVAVVMNFHRLYAVWPGLAKKDPAAIKLRGMAERAAGVEEVWAKLSDETGREPFVVGNVYGVSSSLSFYMPGHPFVYCVMSSIGGRHNQYDFWPGANEMERMPDIVTKWPQPGHPQLLLAGRPAVIVGIEGNDPAVEKLLRPAFERLEGPEYVPMTAGGVVVRKVAIYRGYGFKGFPKISSGTW